MVSFDNYKGREQSYVKHVLLEQYLEALIYRTASVYPHIAYVDGFAGPWQNADEDFNDTSFGIALAALRRARASWKSAGRDVKMTAILVEKSPAAFKQLETLPPKFPDINVKPLKGDFVGLIPSILEEVPKDAFAFFLLDPKGWRIPLRTLQPLLGRANSEVIFNFMFEFINRAVNIDDPVVIAGLDELLPIGNWRDQLLNAHNSEQRKAVLIEAFSGSLSSLGEYKHICETTILRPDRDRPLYSLFYGTRHDTGLEVFRGCQVKALETQANTRAATKMDSVERKTGQSELFDSFHEMSDNEAREFLDGECKRAREAMLALAPNESSPVKYKDYWPKILARHVVTRPNVNKIAAELRKEGRLVFPGWEAKKRVPHADYLLYRKG